MTNQKKLSVKKLKNQINHRKKNYSKKLTSILKNLLNKKKNKKRLANNIFKKNSIQIGQILKILKFKNYFKPLKAKMISNKVTYIIINY